MTGASPLVDEFRDQITLLEADTNPDNAAAVALAIIDGAARGYQKVREESPPREVARALINALGIDPGAVVAAVSTS